MPNAKRSPQRRTGSSSVSNGDIDNGAPSKRLRRTDDEKRAIVQQVLQSDHQGEAIKALGIYPNQFYAWKKEFGGAASTRSSAVAPAGLLDEAKRYVAGRASLLERLRAERAKLDGLITQLERV